jgi:cytochrome c
MRYAAVMLVLSSLPFAAVAHAEGDVEAGKRVFAKCAPCHTLEAGKNKIGPSLHAVLDRPSASLPDFAYSDAMKGVQKVWDAATLETYLADPKALVPGTKMIFPGLKDAKDRTDIVAYLATIR